MTFSLKMPYRLWRRIREDHARRHDHAFERVGFLLARTAALPESSQLILPYEYLVVEDSNYMQDHTVGARINANAIRQALQRTLEDQASLLHVHSHPHSGRPAFSSTDRKCYAELVPSFFNVSPAGVHGALVLSADSISGAMWEKKTSSPVALSRIDIIGSPQLTVGDGYESAKALF